MTKWSKESRKKNLLLRVSRKPFIKKLRVFKLCCQKSSSCSRIYSKIDNLFKENLTIRLWRFLSKCTKRSMKCTSSRSENQKDHLEESKSTKVNQTIENKIQKKDSKFKMKNFTRALKICLMNKTRCQIIEPISKTSSQF